MSRAEDTLVGDLYKTRTAVGAAPGTLSIPADSPPPQIRLFAYNKEQFIERDISTPDEITPWLSGDHTVWIDVQGLGDEGVLLALGRIFNLHPLALEDIAHVPQRPKTQSYAGHQLLFTRMLTGGVDGEVEVEQVAFVIASNYVVSFQERPGDVLDPIRSRLVNGTTKLRSSGSDYLAYALLDTLVDAYVPVIEALGDCVSQLEDNVFEGSKENPLFALNALRSTILSLRRSIWPLRDALKQLIRDPDGIFSPDVRVYLQDVYDHCVNASDMIEAYRELSTGLMNSYLSVVSNRMNEIMKVLTVMSTIFIPLTFLAGVYGMNFAVMPELRWKWSYPILLGAMFVIAASLLYFFKRRGWFRTNG